MYKRQLLVSFTAFALLFTFANRTYDQIFPLTWVDLLLAFVSAAAVYAVSLFKKTDRFALPALAGAVLFTPVTFIDYKSWLIFGAVFLASLRKIDPILLIVLSGVAGYLIYG
mgnify:CR=1 FL=1